MKKLMSLNGISCCAINSCSVCSIEASCTFIIITEKFVITNVGLYIFIINEDLITLIQAQILLHTIIQAWSDISVWSCSQNKSCTLV